MTAITTNEWDSSSGQQRGGVITGGIMIEVGDMGDLTSDITVSYTVATRMTKGLCVIGAVDATVASECGCKVITNYTFCDEGLLELSISDLTTATDGARLRYVAFGW